MLGMIVIDSLAEVMPGSMLNASTYGVPVDYEVVHGATGDRLLQGDPALNDAYVAAALTLARRGARVITGNCGFAVIYESAVREATGLPTCLSALSQLSTIAGQLPAAQRIVIVAYDQASLTDRHIRAAGYLGDLARIERVGLSDWPSWQRLNASTGTLQPAQMESDLVATVATAIDKDTSIGAVLLECTGTCPFVPAVIAAAGGRPVHDINALVLYQLAGVHRVFPVGIVAPPLDRALRIALLDSSPASEPAAI